MRRSDEVSELLDALAGVDGPMPSNDAPDEAWDAWASYQEFEAAAVGLASSPVPGASASTQHLRRLLADERLRALLGERLVTAERLVAALEARHSG
jgi:hypothetical protein